MDKPSADLFKDLEDAGSVENPGGGEPLGFGDASQSDLENSGVAVGGEPDSMDESQETASTAARDGGKKDEIEVPQTAKPRKYKNKPAKLTPEQLEEKKRRQMEKARTEGRRRRSRALSESERQERMNQRLEAAEKIRQEIKQVHDNRTRIVILKKEKQKMQIDSTVLGQQITALQRKLENVKRFNRNQKTILKRLETMRFQVKIPSPEDPKKLKMTTFSVGSNGIVYHGQRTVEKNKDFSTLNQQKNRDEVPHKIKTSIYRSQVQKPSDKATDPECIVID